MGSLLQIGDVIKNRAAPTHQVPGIRPPKNKQAGNLSEAVHLQAYIAMAGKNMQKIRCVHYIQSICEEKGGVARAVLTLCENLARRGHLIDLITGNAQDVPAAWLEPQAGQPSVTLIDYPRYPLAPLSRKSLARITPLLDQAQLLHLHAVWDPVNLRFAALANRHRLPYLVSIHGMLDEWAYSHQWLKKRLYMAAFGRRYLHGASTLHCTAEGEIAQAQLVVPHPRYVTAPHFFDWGQFRTLPGPDLARSKFPILNSPRPKILSLSRIHPVKGADVLIKAAALLRVSGMELEVILAGPDQVGYQRELQELANSLNIGEIVHFLGMVRGPEKVSVYQACDLFALPTFQENFGIVLVEAMAAGIPVITTPQVDIWPELKSAGGVIVERTPEAFAEAIGSLLSQPGDLKSTGLAARASMFDWLDDEAVAQTYEHMYSQAAK
jgi:glycosyltransferase involved in cell wall biosynthesis